MTRRISIMFVFLLVMQTVLSGLNLQTVLAEGKNKGDLTLSLESVKSEEVDIENFDVEEDTEVNVTVGWEMDGKIEAKTKEILDLPENLQIDGYKSGDIVVDKNLLINDGEEIELAPEEDPTEKGTNNDESPENDGENSEEIAEENSGNKTDENSETNENSDEETNSEQENLEENNEEKETTESKKTIGHFSVSEDNTLTVEIDKTIEITETKGTIELDGKLLSDEEETENADNESVNEDLNTEDDDEETDENRNNGVQSNNFGLLFTPRSDFMFTPMGVDENEGVCNLDGEFENFHKEMNSITDIFGNEFSENNPFNPDGEFKLHIKWDLDDGHLYNEGDSVCFMLWDELSIDDEINLLLKDDFGNDVANLHIDTNNKVTLVFTDFVNSASEVQGQFEVMAKLEQEKVQEEDGEITIGPVGEEGSFRVPISLIDRKKDVQKQGKANRKYEGDLIEWEVTVNTGRVFLKDAKITDKLPEGVKYVEGSLEIWEQTTSVDGEEVLKEEKIENLVTSSTDEEISVEFDDIHKQYFVKYKTEITDDKAENFKNKVTFETKNEPIVDAADTVQITRGKPLAKQSNINDFNPVTGVIDWEIQFNYDQQVINGETLTDEWTVEPFHEMMLVDGDVIFTEMEINEDGVAEPKEGGTAPEHDEIMPTLNENGKQIGFEIHNISTDKPYKITYQTKIEGRIIDEIDVSNAAAFGPDATTGTEPGKLGRYYGRKSVDSIDYANKTVTWTIQLNQDKYPMGNIIIEDTLGEGLTLEEESFVIMEGGETYNGNNPELSVNGNDFTLTFPESFVTEEMVNITYQTIFEPDVVPDYEPENSAVIKWTPGSEGNQLSGNVSAKTHFIPEIQDYNWKNAYYDPAKKEITWEIIVNYRENEFDDLIIKDELQGFQTLTPYDFEVYELNIAENGDYTETDEYVLSAENPEITGNQFELMIGQTTKAYKISYKTSLAGLKDITKEYVNEAYVFDGDKKINEEPLEAKAGIYKEQKYADKSGEQENNSKFADWEIFVNIAQEKITDLKLVDTASKNQEYIEDSIKVYEVKYVDGKPEIDEDNPLDTTKYSVEVAELDFNDPNSNPSFTLKWLEDVEQTYVVTYSTLFFAGHGDEIDNSYALTGNEKVLSEDDESKGDTLTIRQTASGSASGKSGRLVIQKKDSSYDFGEGKPDYLEEIEFELLDANTGRLVKKGVTDENGQLDFGRLLYGAYELVEMNIPDGYIAPDNNKLITINTEYSANLEEHTIEIDNYEAVFAIELTKVDSVSKDELEGAEFGVYDTQTDAQNGSNPIMTDTTDENGYILFNLAEANPAVKEAGTYYVREISPPQYYQENLTLRSITIGDKERVPKKLAEIENTLIPGKGELRKIDDELSSNDEIVGLNGAEFEVYNKDDVIVDTFETGTDGIGTTTKLPPGEYTVIEKTPPTGFTKKDENAAFYLEIPKAEEEKTYNITEVENGNNRVDVENVVKRTNIQITKQDSENSSQKIEDVTFKIIDYDDEAYEGRYNEIIDTFLQDNSEATTDDTGIATFEGLPPGVYTIVEHEVPEGYGFIPNDQPFDVPVTHGHVDQKTVVLKEKTNDPLAKITLRKVDSESEYPLEDVQFELYKKDNNDEFQLVENHYKNAIYETGSNGELTITGLSPGEYELREVAEPNGYVLGSNPNRTFIVPNLNELTDNETEIISFTNFADENGAVKNDIVKGSVELTKVDGDDNTLHLDGVVFKLEATQLHNVASENYDEFLTDYNNNELEDSYTTKDGGEISIENLRPGKYKFTEVGTLDGYQLHTWGDPITFEVTVTNDQIMQEVFVENYKLRSIDVEKIWEHNENNNQQPGSIDIQLYQDETPYGSIVELNKDDEFKHVFTELPAMDENGEEYEYFIQELDVTGYEPTVGDVEPKADKAHELATTITNTVKETEIQLNKVDSVTGDALQNAEFGIYHFNDLDLSEAIDTETTNEYGILIFEDIEPGDYIVKEINPPTGYYENETEYEIEVTLDDADKPNTPVLVNNGEVIPNDPFAEVNFIKVDKDSGNGLSGAEFKVVDEQGNDIEGFMNLSVDSEGKLSITGLPEGKYKLVETVAPKGYVLNESGVDFEVSIKGDKETEHKDIVDYDNSIITGSVELMKQDNGDEAMEGVKFKLEATELYFTDNEYLETYNSELTNPYKTGSDGILKINNLRPGIYVLKEDIPEDYQDDYVGNNKGFGDDKGEFEFTINLAEANENIATEFDLGTITNYKKIAIDVEKIWQDDNDATEDRPENIEVVLTGNDDMVEEDTKATINPDNDGKWSYTFENLDVVDSNGNKYEYKVEETGVKGYKAKVTGDVESGFIITNTRIEEIDISGEKTWEYGENGEQYTPDEIIVTLYEVKADKKKKVDNKAPIEVKEENDKWEYVFEDLPRFDNEGVEITYSVEEDTVPGFTTENNGNYNIKNTQTTKEVEITKNWSEVDKQYRPEKITVHVKNGEIIQDTFELSGEMDKETWTHTFSDLPTHDKDGNEITYVVDEYVPEGYTKTQKDNEITNTQNTTAIEVTKKWDEVYPDYRPAGITLQLSNNQNEDVVTHVLEGDKTPADWTYTFEKLPTHNEEGVEIVYTVDEMTPNGYTRTLNGAEITNTQEKTEVAVTKKWIEENSDYRPDNIKLQVKNGDEVIKDHTLSGDNSVDEWSYTFTDLPTHDADGKKITYTVDEEDITGYTKEISQDGLTITNTQETINISGEKTWQDEENTSARPNEEGIIVQVMKVNADESKTEVASETVKPDENGEWSYEFTKLPKYDKDGEKITYVINELNVPGYEADIDGYNITNTRTDKTDISVTKEWLDENENGRPDSITVQLYQNSEKHGDEVEITPDVNGEWPTYTFSDLDQFDKEGRSFTYTIEEVSVDEKYEVLEPQWIAEDNGFTITNVRSGITTIEGTKTWLDENNLDRPESIEVKVFRSVEGEEKSEVGTKIIEKQEGSKWSYIFDYPAFNEEGKAYTYTAEEIVPDGYELKAQDGFNFTNVRVGETEVEVTKNWEHNNAEDIPSEIEFDLFRSSSEVTVEQMNDQESPYKITGQDEWKLTIDELDEFDENGNLYTYSVEERTVAEYNSEVAGNGLDITNTRKTYAIGDYVWIDRNKDGIQDDEPVLDEVTVELYDGDGKKLLETTETDGDGRYIFDELVSGDYKVKFTLTGEQAKKYKFTGQNQGDIAEDSDADQNGWTTEITLNEENKQLTKDYRDQDFKATEGIDPTWDAGVIELVDIVGHKTWQDDNNEEAIDARPNAITVHLLANGKVVDELEVSAADWTFEFIGLDKYDTEGQEIEYTVEEKTVQGYESTINGFDITNLRIGKTEVVGEKIWDEVDEQYRPDSITVHLLANDEVERIVEVSEDTDWSYSFTDLEKYDDQGVEINYTVDEDELTAYDATIDGYDIINTQKAINVSGSKVWLDGDDENRPAKITIQLFANGEEIGSIEISEKDNWQFTFSNLPKYDKDGLEIVYTVDEKEDFADYAKSILDYDITNVRVGTTSVEVEKSWENDEDTNYRPSEIKVDLLRDGEVIDTATITENADWKYTFTDLEKYNSEGEEYQYSIEEHAIKEYDASITETEEGFDIRNTLKEEYTLDSALVGKDDQDGQTVPKTATPYYNLILIGLMLMALGTLYIVWQKTKRARREF